MLDQNTDRMWYVIGAIIIGGLILTSTIVLFTDVAFASVQDAFSMLSNVPRYVYVDGEQVYNLIDPLDPDVQHKAHIHDSNGKVMMDVPEGEEHTTTGFIPVESGKTYRFLSQQGNGLYFSRYAYYDENKQPIRSERFVSGEPIAYYDITPPKSVKYIRLSGDARKRKSNKDDRMGPIEQWVLYEAVAVSDEEWFDGATMVYDTNDFSFLNSHRGAKVNMSTSQKIFEWGVDNATRIQTSGGSEVTKVYKTLVKYADSIDGREYLYSVKVKNNGEYPTKISANSGGGSPGYIVLDPGQSQIIRLLAYKSAGDANIQFQLMNLAENIDEDIDIYLHGFKFGYRD